MSEKDREILTNLAKGLLPKEIPLDCQYHDELTALVSYLKKIEQYAVNLSKGELSLLQPNTIQGSIYGSLKTLHANLRHLSWQMHCVAAGDLSQQLDFMGEFSSSFNKMIDQLVAGRKLEIERNELEKLRQYMNKEESLGRMAGAIAHHFNNILTTIMSSIDLALTELHFGLPAAYLNNAMNASKKAAELSDMMLVYLGKKFSLNQPVDTIATCQKTISMLPIEMQNSIVWLDEQQIPGPLITGDPNQLHIAIRNLLTNAFEAYDNGPKNVKLSVGTVTSTSISSRFRQPLDWQAQEEQMVCIGVSDSGKGMKADTFDKIFDPFFSTKFTGRGLGLAVTLGIVRAHKGVITVESSLGAGSAFKIFLPLLSTVEKFDNVLKQ